MSVTVNVAAADGLFVPFRTQVRGGGDGSQPVGTLSVDAGAVGDMSGGSIVARITMQRQMFGFPAIWVPTTYSFFDTLAAAEAVLVTIQSGNERTGSDFVTSILLLRAAGTDAGIISDLVLPLNGESNVEVAAVQAVWATNTNVTPYHMHVFGPVYDAQLFAVNGVIPLMVAGVR